VWLFGTALLKDFMSIMKVKFVVIGAGPAGLSFAAELKRRGEQSFFVLEKEKKAGGLCRSAIWNDAPVDIGGGHILDKKKKHIIRFLFSYMPECEWDSYERDSRIAIGDTIVGYPLEANIWQFPLEEQLEYLLSIAATGSVAGKPMPALFTDWIYWKLGEKIAETYMLPYNRKIWSYDLDALGTYWLYKLPDVSFRDVLESCLLRASKGKPPAHGTFYYPKTTGYGEVFLRIADTLKEHMQYEYAVNTIDCGSRKINGEIEADYIINTAPWNEFANSLPFEIQDLVKQLHFTSIDIDCYNDDSYSDKAHWTYYADEKLPYHRIIHRDNIIKGSKGYWTETNSKRRSKPGEFHYENKYAYPLNTVNKPQVISDVLKYMERLNIFGLGRWGEWEHMNSDIAIERGIQLSERFVRE